MRINLLYRPTIWLYGAQRVLTWYPLRRILTYLIASTKRRHKPSTPNPIIDSVYDSLLKDGISHLPNFIDACMVERIKSHLVGAYLSERFATRRGGFTLENAPPNVHVAEYLLEDVLACSDVLAIANHPVLIDAAARYLGCKPTISSLSVWWSLPADGTAQEAENYHRDVDDWRFVKFFLYLTDVDEDSGPHCFVRGSHRTSNFLRIRRISDLEVVKAFPKQDLLGIKGRAGDAFLEDTFGLHKGQPPNSKKRLLLQVQYSINPIIVYKYSPIHNFKADVEIDPYINRLILSYKHTRSA